MAASTFFVGFFLFVGIIRIIISFFIFLGRLFALLYSKLTWWACAACQRDRYSHYPFLAPESDAFHAAAQSASAAQWPPAEALARKLADAARNARNDQAFARRCESRCSRSSWSRRRPRMCR